MTTTAISDLTPIMNLRRCRRLRFTPSPALMWPAFAVVVTLAGLLYSGRPAVPTPSGPRDVDIYAAIVANLQAGEPYYIAVGSELRRGGYPTWPLMNWRTPLHFSTVAAVGIERSSYALVAVAIAMIALGVFAFARRSLPAAIWATVVLMGTALQAFWGSRSDVLLSELWAGLLIGLSLGAYQHRWWTAAASLGVIAIFLRELAVPYGLVSGLIAIREGRRRESLVWIAGGLAYVLYYSIHASHAATAVKPEDFVTPHSWIQWQGLPFLLQTIHCYGWLFVCPLWVSAIALGLSCVAMAAPSMPVQTRAACLVYAGLFLMIGQSFDFYWGFVTAPIWAYVFAHVGEGVCALGIRRGPDREEEGACAPGHSELIPARGICRGDLSLLS